MSKIIVKENESVDAAIRRFKKRVISDGTLMIVKNKEFYKSKATKRREKHKAAVARLKKNKKY